MSKQKQRGRPKATSPEPPIPATTEATIPPEAVPPTNTPPAREPAATVPPASEPIPPVPGHVRGLARVVREKFDVPEWLTILAAWTGSKFGTATPAANNYCGVKARGTEPVTPDGFGWYPNIPFSFGKFGEIVRGMALDYTDAAACIRALKARCPNIDATDHNTFMEV